MRTQLGPAGAVGMSLGTAIGIALHNVAFGAVLGAGVGFMYGLLSYLTRPALPAPQNPSN